MAKKYITGDKLKKNTLADIFVFILEHRQTSRREIEYETGFSWGTVSSNVAYLLEKGYITEEKSAQSGTAGRTTYVLKPTSDGVVSIGLDINRTGLSCVAVGIDSQIKQSFFAPFDAHTCAEVLAQAESLCRRAVDACTQDGARLFSLGVAIQGTVNGRLGISTRFPGIADWQAFDVKTHFARRFDLPVYLGHDPKCMLLGEMCRSKINNCVLVRIDDGIGMAVSLDGKILDDTERLELGHTVAVRGGRRCNCGRCGCLEAYASLPAMATAAECEPEELFRTPARYGAVLQEAGGHLAAAMCDMHALFRPEKVILTGKAVRLAPFIEQAVSALAEEGVDVSIDPDISAAYGAAVESMKSAIKSFMI